MYFNTSVWHFEDVFVSELIVAKNANKLDAFHDPQFDPRSFNFRWLIIPFLKGSFWWQSIRVMENIIFWDLDYLHEDHL